MTETGYRHTRILERLGRHEKADDRYIDEGARLLNLAQRVTELFGRQDPGERQRLLVTILRALHYPERGPDPEIPSTVGRDSEYVS